MIACHLVVIPGSLSYPFQLASWIIHLIKQITWATTQHYYSKLPANLIGVYKFHTGHIFFGTPNAVLDRHNNTSAVYARNSGKVTFYQKIMLNHFHF